MAYGTVNTPSSPAQGGGKRLILATIGTNWTDNAANGTKEQFIPIEEITDQHDVSIYPVDIHEETIEGHAMFTEEKNQFLQHVTNGTSKTVDGGIKIIIFKEAPTIAVPIGVEVI